jgi:hypothetical protein
MKNTADIRISKPARATGAVAVELALLLVFTWVLLPGIVLFGKVFWQYHVLSNAQYTAARYMAAGSLEELQTLTVRHNVAKEMIRRAAREAGISGEISPDVECVPRNDCVLPAPRAITINTPLYVEVPHIPGVSEGRFPIWASATVGYPN